MSGWSPRTSRTAFRNCRDSLKRAFSCSADSPPRRIEPVDLRVLVGGLVAVDYDLVAWLPASDALANLPYDPRRIRAADVVAVLGMVAVAEHRHRLPERRPHVVVVDAGGHHPDDDLERAGLGDLYLLELERVDRLALSFGADHPRRHRAGQRA